MPVTQINSDDLIDTEQHFRVSAGPGAGKTYWLVNHIKNVLHKSERLGKTRKIACITYTNVAVETIQKRLGTASERVEVSTIHSFLYKNIIKPYISFIADEFNFDVTKLDGHDEINVSMQKVIEWANTTNQKYLLFDKKHGNPEKVVESLKNLLWCFDNTNKLIVKPNPQKPWLGKISPKFSIRNNSYLEYKKILWCDGRLHHDDVLFFSCHLINEYPFLLRILQTKFPYFFVDEFQDTSPLQTQIIRDIGQKETVIGVIGDKAQSIFSFQGAELSHFDSFSQPDIQDYVMKDNHRTTNKNIRLLNLVRTDIEQKEVRNIEGEKPMLIIGDMFDSFRKAKTLCGENEICSLSRINPIANSMKTEMNPNIPSSDLLQTLYNTDSNTNRRKTIIACIKATELARQEEFKQAIKELERLLKIEDKMLNRKEALKIIALLLKKYSEFKDETLSNFHSLINNNIKSISGLSTGKAKDFYDTNTYQQLALCVKITEDDSLHRTIHGAKGDQFDNVFLVLKSEDDLDFLHNPNLADEEHRIKYVAISRAKNRLFINVPTLSDENKAKLEALNFDVL